MERKKRNSRTRSPKTGGGKVSVMKFKKSGGEETILRSKRRLRSKRKRRVVVLSMERRLKRAAKRECLWGKS